MSQLTLTPQEDQIVLDALRSKGAAYTAMFGSMDPSIEALIAKVEGQLPVATPVAVVEEVAAPVVEEVVVEAPKAKKTKAVEETPEEN
jgi:hypothetical protein